MIRPHAAVADEIACLVQYLVNYGSTDIPTPWTFSIMNPDYLEVFQTWNWESNGMDSTGKATGYANQVSCSAPACGVSYIAACTCYTVFCLLSNPAAKSMCLTARWISPKRLSRPLLAPEDVYSPVNAVQ